MGSSWEGEIRQVWGESSHPRPAVTGERQRTGRGLTTPGTPGHGAWGSSLVPSEQACLWAAHCKELFLCLFPLRLGPPRSALCPPGVAAGPACPRPQEDPAVRTFLGAPSRAQVESPSRACPSQGRPGALHLQGSLCKTACACTPKPSKWGHPPEHQGIHAHALHVAIWATCWQAPQPGNPGSRRPGEVRGI